MYIEITPTDYRVQFRYQSDPDYDSEIIDFAKLKQDLVVTYDGTTADKTYADITFAVAHGVAVILNDTSRHIYARLYAYGASDYTFDAMKDNQHAMWKVTNGNVWTYSTEQPTVGVLSFNGRTGAVMPQDGDYDIPTKTSDLTNDSGFLTEHQSLAEYRKASAQDVIDATKIGDAPSDNKQYARKNGAWAEVQGGGGGTSDHSQLSNRDAANQHPVSAITGLQSALDGKQGAIADLDTIRSGASAGATAVRPEALQAVTAKIPEQASADNQLADKAFVNSSIQNVAAYYITKDAAGNPFATKADLGAATTYYSGGEVRVPTRNDYCVVLADESKTIAETGENPTTRYIYGGSSWSYQYIVNRSGMTAAQWAAVNSNITAAAVIKLGALPTAAELEVLLAGKEDAANKVTSLSSSSTNTQYPGAKAVYDFVSDMAGNIESLLAEL